jgi:hypothetical protein
MSRHRSRPAAGARYNRRPGWLRLLAAALVMAAVAFATPRAVGGACYGLLAGLTFGNSAIAARVLGPVGSSAVALATSPLR